MKRNHLHHGVVIAIENDYIIILDSEGAFQRLKYKENLTIGDQIYFFDTDFYTTDTTTHRIRFKPLVSALLIAAFVLIFLTTGYQYFNTENVYAAVSFGTQTGVQVELNKQEKIIQLTTSENKQLEEDWLGKDIKEVTPYLLNHFNDPENMKDMLVGLSSDDSEWIQAYERFLVKEGAEAENVTNMIVIKGDLEDYQNAQEDQMLLGDYQLASSQINYWEITENNVLSAQEKQQLLGNDGDYYNLTPYASIEQFIERFNQMDVPEALNAVLNTFHRLHLNLKYSEQPDDSEMEEDVRNIHSSEEATTTEQPIMYYDDYTDDDDWDDDDWDDDWDDDDWDDDWDDDDWDDDWDDDDWDDDWDDDDWDDDDWDDDWDDDD